MTRITLEQRILKDLYTFFRIHPLEDLITLFNQELSSDRLSRICARLIATNYMVRHSPYLKEVLQCHGIALGAATTGAANVTDLIAPDTSNVSIATTSQEEV